MPLRKGARLKADLVDRKILLHTPQEDRKTSQGDYDLEEWNMEIHISRRGIAS